MTVDITFSSLIDNANTASLSNLLTHHNLTRLCVRDLSACVAMYLGERKDHKTRVNSFYVHVFALRYIQTQFQFTDVWRSGHLDSQ
jgi:hypothetical protein